MLLLKTRLHVERLKYRKSLVLPLMNVMLGMNPWLRKRVHDSMQADFTSSILPAYTAHPFAHSPEDKYKVSIGYFRGKGEETGKKTKTLDADGLSYILKVAVDTLIKNTSIPTDSIFTIPEVRCVYLGEKTDEEIWLQVERICPETTLEASIPEKPSVGTHEPKSGSDVPPKAKMEEIYRDSYINT